MKKVMVIAAMMFSTAIQADACDICGCGAGSAYIGILPEFNAKIIGIRYRYNSLQTHLGPGGSVSYLTTDEAYHTTELWGGWTIRERFRIMASLPVSYNSKASQESRQSKTGLGDAAVQGFYRLVSKRSNIATGKLLVQDLWIGAGIKAPTGKYEPKDKETVNKSANLFQLGTGSFDFMLTAMYDLRLQDAGLNITGSYKLNTTNKYDYNYGNKLTGSAQLYYKFKVKETVTIAPNLGMAYEKSGKDLDGGYGVYSSGGYLLSGTAGAELMYKKISLGGNFQPALSQNLAHGLVKANNRMMVHLSILL